MTLGQELAEMALITKEKICDEWFIKLQQTKSIEELVKMYVRGIDFCFSNEYPSNEYIRNNFKGKMEVFGVYLDDIIAIDNKRKLVLLGETIASLTYTDFNVCQLYMKDNSTANVVAKDNSILCIDIFYNSKLNIVCNDNSKVIINNFGGEIKIEKSETAKVKLADKGKRSY